MRRDALLATLLTLSVTGVAAAGALHGHRADDRDGAPQARRTPGRVLALVEAQPSSAARGALRARLAAFSEVAPDWGTVAAGGYFRYRATDPRTLDLAERGARIVPTVRDPQRLIGSVLADETARNRLARRLSAALGATGADGVVLDIASVPAEARRSYPAFVRTLATLLGPRRTVFVTVPGVADDAEAGALAGYDVRDLARPAYVIVRSLDEHDETTAPGPIASLEWFRRVVRRSIAAAPGSRLLFAVPTYGRRWRTGAPAALVTQADVYPHLSEQRRLEPDGAERTTAQGDREWVETDRSVGLKLRVVAAAHVAGAVVWLRGGESTHQWRAPILDGTAPAAWRAVR